jgi:hypothetical protein
MKILLISGIIYLLGVAIILWMKPELMFREDGTWKEFGVGRGNERTVIPFWLFAIFWAFISYGTALVIMSQFATIALNAFPESSLQIPQPATPSLPISSQVPQSIPAPSFMKPISSAFGINPGNPGFYVLQNTVNGAPHYVYYGQSPPMTQ